MTEIPAENYSPVWAADTRDALPLAGDERETLTAFLDWHRATFALKCAGVPREKLSEKSIPPSGLSLHGIARHLAGTERWWFRMQFVGEELPHLYYTDEDPDQDFDALDGDIDDVLTVWREECERSRAIVAAASLDDVAVAHSRGQAMSLRRIVVHMLAEYARHNGHADLLRERIDGATGS